MSTEPIYQATLEHLSRHVSGRQPPFRHLDIGSGSGDLARMVREHFAAETACCDYTGELMSLPGQHVDIIDLNRMERLPYDDDRFDFVTATEVIEHLEDYRKLFSEAYRVLKPGGMLVVSTPNILNINSRLRNLWFGFAELMGPLPIHARKLESCAGHINPVSLFYIMHALAERNFHALRVTVDRYQRSGMAKLLLLWIPLRLMAASVWRREVKRYGTIDASNSDLVRRLNSLPILLGRTVVVSAVK